MLENYSIKVLIVDITLVPGFLLIFLLYLFIFIVINKAFF